ncbi:MAG: potassium transporter [Zetaproteobacteria bacterium]|nr:MAG: potassium transporter [Zetaproteobacteria bacterium]
MEHAFLNHALFMLIAAVASVALFLRLGLPPILGYLIVGMLMGPGAAGFISDSTQIRSWAEIGIVFLMFTIGLEFSWPVLRHMKSAVLGLGGLQVMLTMILIDLLAIVVGIPWEQGLVIGGIIAMSSTALVTKILADQAELQTRHGRNSLGILLFQDIMVVPLLILVGLLGQERAMPGSWALAMAAAEGLIVLSCILAFGHWVLRPLIREIARFQSAELFTLFVLLIVLASAWMTERAGLSLALGAFLAGVMLSETEFHHQVASEIRPFRDVLLGLFFITVGMMLDLGRLPQIGAQAFLLACLLIITKLLIITLACRIGSWNMAVAFRTGLCLAHGGEFGFAILILALDEKAIDPLIGQIVLTAMLISMLLAPLLIRFNGSLTARLMPNAAKRSREEISSDIRDKAKRLSHHVIVCGYGRIGHHTVEFLRSHHVPCLAIELDLDKVRQGKNQGRPVSYGDAASLELLRACGLERAAAVIITMIDFATVMKILKRIRSMDRDIPVVVRTRKEIHLYQLYQAGASEVIADTFGNHFMLTEEVLKRWRLDGAFTPKAS